MLKIRGLDQSLNQQFRRSHPENKIQQIHSRSQSAQLLKFFYRPSLSMPEVWFLEYFRNAFPKVSSLLCRAIICPDLCNLFESHRDSRQVLRTRNKLVHLSLPKAHQYRNTFHASPIDYSNAVPKTIWLDHCPKGSCDKRMMNQCAALLPSNSIK